MWFIGVEVEQETRVPSPKKNPGSAPARGESLFLIRTTGAKERGFDKIFVTSTFALDFEASVSVVNSLHVLIILFYHMMVLKLFFKNVISDH